VHDHAGDVQVSLLCRICHGVLCALPLECVEETMRPLTVHPMPGAPLFIQGLALVRGVPTPVVDAASLLGRETAGLTRFVTLKTGTRRVALAVNAVIGVIETPSDTVASLPSLFHNTPLDVIAAIGARDGELLVVLHHARLVPDQVWAAAVHAMGVSA
jgi:purine-binding chemotaxis protein CheW